MFRSPAKCRTHVLRQVAISFAAWIIASNACLAAPPLDLLKQLSEAPVRRIVVDALKPLSSDIQFDGMGSVIAAQGSGRTRVMLDAHMDEVGGMVRDVTPSGYMTVQPLGGWLNEALVGQRWLILTKRGVFPAVSTTRDGHLLTTEERKSPPSGKEVYLDVGAASEQDAQAIGIEPGDGTVPQSSFILLAGGKRVVGKAFDDRAGLVAMIDVMRELQGTHPTTTLFAAAAVQEEVGLRGAITAANKIRPDVGIAIDCAAVNDTPEGGAEAAQAPLGGGPVIYLYLASDLPNPKLVDFVKAIAASHHIPIQLDASQGAGFESASIQRSGSGVPTIGIGIPVRYMHNHNGVMELSDLDATVKLVAAVIQSLDSTEVARLTHWE
jgi:putative aminopeptidase FrvX